MAEKNARSLNAEMAGSILEKGGFLLKEGATKLYLDESEFSFSCKEGTGMDKAKILALFYYCAFTTGRTVRYQWTQHEEWTPCSVGCGQGISEAIFKCHDQTTASVVLDSLCTDQRPLFKKECYERPCFDGPGNKDYNLYAAHYDDRLSNQYEDVDFDTKHYSAYERLTQKLYDSIYNKPYTGVEKLDEFDDSASVPHGKDQYGGDFDGLENVQYRHPSSDDVTTESPALADNQYEVFVNSNRTLDEDNLQTNYRHVGGGKKKKDAAKKKVYRGHWFIGDWGECSATCGQGTISREFACVNHENTAVLPDSDCPPKRPKAYKICELKECKDVMTWNVGEWSQCPEECESKRQRKVHCQSLDGRTVHDLYCKELGQKPDTTEKCGRPCVRWVAGRWRDCKHKKQRSCRDAVQTRCVLCLHEKTFQMSTRCNVKTKPQRKKSCAKQACAANIK